MRITYRIVENTGTHIRFQLWVNGGLICTPGGLCVRITEFEILIERLSAISDTDYYLSQFLDNEPLSLDG